MVGAIQAMEKAGIAVYPLWWALNLGTSIGGFGSPIAAACNVIAFGQAEKEEWQPYVDSWVPSDTLDESARGAPACAQADSRTQE